MWFIKRKLRRLACLALRFAERYLRDWAWRVENRADVLDDELLETLRTAMQEDDPRRANGVELCYRCENSLAWCECQQPLTLEWLEEARDNE